MTANPHLAGIAPPPRCATCSHHPRWLQDGRCIDQRWAQSTGRVSGLDATANPWWTDGTGQCKYAGTWRAGHSTEAIATTPARPFERDDNT